MSMFTSRRLLGFLVVSLVFSLPLHARGLDWYTFSAEAVKDSSLSVSASLGHGRNTGDQAIDGLSVDAPIVQLNLGLGERAEAIVGYSLYRQRNNADVSVSGGGDPYFFTKLNFYQANVEYLPSAAFIWGVIEPAANRPLGDDRLSFYALLALSWQLDDITFDVNYGAGIFESFNEDGQIDVIQFSTAAHYDVRETLRFSSEFVYEERIVGFWLDFTGGYDSPFSRRHLTLKSDFGNRLQWSASVTRGLIEQSGDWAGNVGYRYHF
ncbi:MAG: hypothetical protein JXQ97_15515 [Natronospirillum sp.]